MRGQRQDAIAPPTELIHRYAVSRLTKGALHDVDDTCDIASIDDATLRQYAAQLHESARERSDMCARFFFHGS